MAALHAIAPAKLNLYLHVHGRRADGYHLIESLAVFTEPGDVVHVREADALHLSCEGEFAEAAGGGEGNLVLKAAHLLQRKTGCTKGAHITLTKNIPVGAGLGGGSSDAAVTLKLLNRLWELDVDDAMLCDWAPELGADVAMCVRARPVIAENIGERLREPPCALPPLHVLLVHPRTPLLTKHVYAALATMPLHSHQAAYTDMACEDAGHFLRWLGRQRNDLQPAAMQVSAEVAGVLDALAALNPALVRMSGSGACCYALYSTAGEAAAASVELARRHPSWWVRTGRIAQA